MGQFRVWLFAVVWAGVSAGPAFAGKEEFVAACTSSSNLGQAVCECCAGIAQAEFSPAGFDFITATLKGDQASVDALRGQLAMPEMIRAGMFMVNTPARCAQESAQ